MSFRTPSAAPWRDLHRVDLLAWADAFDGCPAADQRRLGLGVSRRDGVTLLVAPGLDSLLFNRAFGLGFDGPVTPALVRFVTEGYRAAGVDRFFVHAPARPAPELHAALTEGGLTPYRRAWVKLVRDGAPPPEVATPLEVAEARPDEADAVAELFALGFEAPPESRALVRPLVRRANWRVLVARDRGQVVAAAALFVHRAVASQVFAVTRPDQRGRGAQQALLAARLELAHAAGCRWITAETGAPVADEPNPSLRNLERLGFRWLTRIANYAPPEVTSWTRTSADRRTPTQEG